jgi:RNA polymerase sigma-70 factor (ECF subfamily)
VIYNYRVTQHTNEKWLNDLQDGGDLQSQALGDLRAVILRGLPHALSGKISPVSPDFRTLADRVAQKTLVYVQDHLGDYAENSAFTTWVLKFAVRQALLELRLYQWQAVTHVNTLPEIPPAMYEKLAQDGSWQRVHQIFKEELTQNQRVAIRSMVMLRMPKEEVAQYLGMELCDYFEMIHDARLRLKRRLKADGLLPLEKTVQE